MLNVNVYVRVRELVCVNERARGEVWGMPIQFFTIALGKVRLHNCLGHPESFNSRSGGRRQGTGKIIHCDSIHSNGCTVYEATDRIYFPQRNDFPIRDQISMNNSFSKRAVEELCCWKNLFPEWNLFLWKWFLISREGLDISSSRTTVRD